MARITVLKRNLQDCRGFSMLVVFVCAVTATACEAQQPGGKEQTPKKYRGVLGSDSKKIKKEDGKTFLWAGGGSPTSPEARWYDFTGAPILAAELQFGIGKDRIRAIDDPAFVSADDPRLLKLRPSPYRRDERPKTNDEIMVIGHVYGDQARAYPVALLDHHELVNDKIGDKALTVGW